MKALEFEGTLMAGGQIVLPPDLAGQIPAGEQLRVLILWKPSGEDLSWQTASDLALESAYSPEDAVYEQLIHDPSVR